MWVMSAEMLWVRYMGARTMRACFTLHFLGGDKDTTASHTSWTAAAGSAVCCQTESASNFVLQRESGWFFFFSGEMFTHPSMTVLFVSVSNMVIRWIFLFFRLIKQIMLCRFANTHSLHYRWSLWFRKCKKTVKNAYLNYPGYRDISWLSKIWRFLSNSDKILRKKQISTSGIFDIFAS